MKKQKLAVIAAALTLLVSVASPVSAIQSPSGCNSNRLNLSLIKDKTAVQQGEVITYTVTVTNVDSAPAIACDIDNATVTVRLPAADGTPTGTLITLATGANYPAGFTQTTVGTTTYTVATNPGVTDIVAEARVSGVLHDAPVDHAAEIIKTVGTAIITPAPPASSTSNEASSPAPTAPKLPNAGVPRAQ